MAKISFGQSKLIKLTYPKLNKFNQFRLKI